MRMRWAECYHLPARAISRALPCFGVALLSFAGMALLLHALLPDPSSLPTQYRTSKLALIERWSGKANIAAFGTSRLHEGFLPATFDAVFGAEPGAAPFSVNLAVVAGSLTEQRMLAKRYLAHATCPNLLMLEINAGLNMPPETRFDPRTVNLYDTDVLHFVLFFRDTSISFPRRLGRIFYALTASAAHAMNAGMLGSVLFPVAHPSANEDARGRIGLPQTPEERMHVAEMFAVRPAAPDIISKTVGEGYRQLLADIAGPKRNMRFLYIVAPMLEDMTQRPDYPAHMDWAGGDVPILNMARPDLFPEIYRPEHWRNATHMTRQGAETFSRLLAGEVAKQGFTAQACGK